MAYQAKYWNGSAWVAVANASFDTSGLVKTTGNTGTVDLSGATVVKGAGMDLIVPTSVTGGTFSASGAISFSAATAVNVNGCFTSAYENYRVVLSNVVGSTDIDVLLRLRGSGVDNSASNYLYGRYYVGVSASVAAASTNNTTATSFFVSSASTTGVGVSSIDVYSPLLTARTAVSVHGHGRYMVLLGGQLTVSTAYDGFTLLADTGTITGSLRIYGYHN